VQITVTVNGVAQTRDVEPRLLLVHFLRDALRTRSSRGSPTSTACSAGSARPG
jgi:aerobic carbon-monoxide dehydrogenase small subunit